MLQAGRRNVETRRLPFELDHTSVLSAQIVKHFGKYIFQLFVTELGGAVVMVEVRVGYVECRSQLVGRGVGGIPVHPA